MAIPHDLEARRNALLEQMRGIRSMERGTITEQFFHRSRPGEKRLARQGPYYVFSRREGGKTMSRRLSRPAELERAQQDVKAYKEFVALCQEFARLTEQMGRLERPDAELAGGKKTAQIVLEQNGEVKKVLETIIQAKQMDLEACENALRRAVLAAGATALEGLLRGVGCGRESQEVLCGCGGRMESQGLKSKEVLTILGPVHYERSMFQCSCGASRYPGDELLDIVGTSRSPGLRRMMARAGSQSTFKEGCEDLRVYAGIRVSPKDLERVAEGIGQEMEGWAGAERQRALDSQGPVSLFPTIPVLYVSYDGTGVPMTAAEVEGRRGKQADGSAKTREAKLGCVFTQATTDAKGFAVRDPESTTFVGAIESAEAFGERIYGEAVRRGLGRAERVVILGDGAEWVKNLAQMHFPEATLIVDLYHARQHVSELCKDLFSGDEKKIGQYRLRWWTDLNEGKVEKIVRQARAENPRDAELAQKAQGEIRYLEKNRERMRYAQFRAQGLFVGSGVIEAGCKTVIGQRLKQSGMEWSVRGANAIIALRSIIKSDRFEDYWESRAL